MNSTTGRGWLAEHMDIIAGRMQLDFEASASLKHSGSKGAVRETALRRDFLTKYVSGAARVFGNGELISTDGQVSGECDLMIVEPSTPPLWSDEDYALVPAECCYVVIEVKSFLSTDELRKSWTAAKQIKSMPRTAYSSSRFSRTHNVHGRDWSHAGPIRHIVFGYDGAALETLAAELSRLATEDSDAATGIDALCVLKRGVVSWHTIQVDLMFERLPDSIVFAAPTNPGDVLLFMMTVINAIVAVSRLNDRVDLSKYVTASLGQVDSWWRNGRQISIFGGQEFWTDELNPQTQATEP